MLHYVYYPFPPRWEDPTNATTLKRYTQKYSSPANNSHAEAHNDVLIYKPQPMPTEPEKGPLRRVRDCDLLLIAAHGGKDMTYIQSGEPKSEKLTHEDLAAQLLQAGLPRKHVLIKMLTCFATGTLVKDKPVNGGKVNRTGSEFFARLLAKSLKKLEYNEIIVGGYPGGLNTGGPPSRWASDRKDNVNVDVEGGPVENAHDWIQWWDGEGKEVDRARIAALKDEFRKRDGKFDGNDWKGRPKFVRNAPTPAT
jgi:hypothetical protein